MGYIGPMDDHGAKAQSVKTTWNTPVPEIRWKGFRRVNRGVEAFQSLDKLEAAQVSELEESLSDHERQTLGRLLSRGKKLEIDIFIRSHGSNPLFHPQDDIDVSVGVAKADVVDLGQPPTPEAINAILNGDVVHVLFQAGDATRFQKGPLYQLNPLNVVDALEDVIDLAPALDQIEKLKRSLSPEVGAFLVDSPLGVKQPILLRAAVRRLVQYEIESGKITAAAARERYQAAIKAQKILFFIPNKGGIGDFHREILIGRLKFFGFDPANLLTIEQQMIHGVSADEDGNIKVLEEEWAMNPAGHLYALLQAARAEDFTVYSETGRPLKSPDVDGLAYLRQRGGKILNIIRINDMDRHTTEIINAKALSYALVMFAKGYVNIIEGVANSTGQKGGTGTTFGDPEIHVLTETHENSFPSLSRAFEAALQTYLATNKRHPAYNAMRQWADLAATRQVLQEFGARLVFVPRQKEVDGEIRSYLGLDMPMGDLSLLQNGYKSRMFQFADPMGRELHIHDVKTIENLPVALRTVKRQLEDPFIVAAAEEVLFGKDVPFKPKEIVTALYGAPAPEFEQKRA